MAATPVVLLAPAPDMTFMSLPSGASYTSNQYALVTITNGSVADEEALIAAGCQALTGGLVTTVAALPSPIAGSSAYVTDFDRNAGRRARQRRGRRRLVFHAGLRGQREHMADRLALKQRLVRRSLGEDGSASA